MPEISPDLERIRSINAESIRRSIEQFSQELGNHDFALDADFAPESHPITLIDSVGNSHAGRIACIGCFNANFSIKEARFVRIQVLDLGEEIYRQYDFEKGATNSELFTSGNIKVGEPASLSKPYSVFWSAGIGQALIQNGEQLKLEFARRTKKLHQCTRLRSTIINLSYPQNWSGRRALELKYEQQDQIGASFEKWEDL